MSQAPKALAPAHAARVPQALRVKFFVSAHVTRWWQVLCGCGRCCAGRVRLPACCPLFRLHRDRPRRFRANFAPHDCSNRSNMVPCPPPFATTATCPCLTYPPPPPPPPPRLLIKTAMGAGGEGVGGYRRVEWKCDLLNSPSARAALRCSGARLAPCSARALSHSRVRGL